MCSPRNGARRGPSRWPACWHDPCRDGNCVKRDSPETSPSQTALPTAEETKHLYRLRLGVEEMFKDLQHTFALESCQCQSTDRITRVGSFALVSFPTLALRVRFPEGWLRYVTARGALSFLTLALEWLNAPPDIRRTLGQVVRCGQR